MRANDEINPVRQTLDQVSRLKLEPVIKELHARAEINLSVPQTAEFRNFIFYLTEMGSLVKAQIGLGLKTRPVIISKSGRKMAVKQEYPRLEELDYFRSLLPYTKKRIRAENVWKSIEKGNRTIWTWINLE